MSTGTTGGLVNISIAHLAGNNIAFVVKDIRIAAIRRKNREEILSTLYHTTGSTTTVGLRSTTDKGGIRQCGLVTNTCRVGLQALTAYCISFNFFSRSFTSGIRPARLVEFPVFIEA
jgi:hypothetical protein